MAFEGMPGYDLINVVRDLDPVEAVRDQEAAERMRVYPKVVGAGPPDFGCAEQAGGTWRVLSLGAAEPAGARVDLAIHLRTAAETSPADAGELVAAARRLDPEEDEGEADRASDWPVAGRRFRIVRVLGFTRFGADGPEPARATDTEEAPLKGYPIDPVAPVGPSEAALRLELLSLVPAAGTVPEAERREAVDAVKNHPGVVLLPPEYTVVEERDAGWSPITGGSGPGDARRALAYTFREILPRFPLPGRPEPTPGELAEYAAAAGRIEAAVHEVEFVVAGRRYRTIRVVRMIRVGPDGPEPARPSDESAADAYFTDD